MNKIVGSALLLKTYILSLNIFFKWDYHYCDDNTDHVIMHNAKVYLILKESNLPDEEE